MINRNKIKGRMAELGFSQKDLAQELGIAQAHLSQKFNGHRPIKLDEAEKLARALQIPDHQFGAYFFSSAS